MSEICPEIKEIQPRGKILFLGINPDQPAHINLAPAMFDTDKDTVEESSKGGFCRKTIVAVKLLSPNE